ncbi:hypothetical protein ACLI09_05915 [Flavobacterium sp. RHBU_24]|uniref:hypothetical protein n=1 Tax=Flavobacterium sp. RHBU_24 TaxID=3391185 RepID=UPI0039854A97
MKRLTFLLLFISASAFAQNDMKARIEYEDAETSFAAGDFPTTLSHLEEATKLLNGGNTKIMYLQILTERELAKKDTVYFSKVKKTIEDFEKLPGYPSFSDDKKAEVYRIYKKLNDDKAAAISGMADKKISDENFKKYSYLNWPFDITIDELKKLAGNKGFFRKTKVVDKEKKDFYGYKLYQLSNWDLSTMTHKGLQGVLYDDNNMVKGYYIVKEQGYYEGHISAEQFKSIVEPTLTELTGLFGFNPEIQKDSDYSMNYRWSKDNKLVLYSCYAQDYKDQTYVYNSISILTK